MFVRFRQTKHHLQVSLVENRRIDRHVRQEHVAGVPADIQGKILGDIHACIPMATLDEIQAAKIEAAEADEHSWSGLHEMHTEQIAKAEGQIVDLKIEAEKTAAGAAEAKDRVERLKRREDVDPGGS